jgi:hypothetical protein
MRHHARGSDRGEIVSGETIHSSSLDGMIPEPLFEVLNEVNTPKMFVVVRCSACRQIVTHRQIDVSDANLLRNLDSIAEVIAEEDTMDWLRHVSSRHGGTA